MIFIPIPQYSYFVILMFIEIKPIGFSVLQLQEVVVQALFADANFLGSFFEGLTVFIV